MSMNKAFLVGRLGKDPEFKPIQGGSLCNFSITTSEYYKGRDGQRQERTEWHNIVAFGKLAEICQKLLKKGSQVVVEGKIQTRSWEDTEGVKRYRTEIIAARIEAVGNQLKLAEDKVDFDEIPF